jgi:hypothetical protein
VETRPEGESISRHVDGAEASVSPDAKGSYSDPVLSSSDTEVSHSAPSTIDYQLLTESVHRGFVFLAARLAVYTEHEIFGRGRRRGDNRKHRFKGFSLRELQALRRFRRSQ